MNLKEEKVDKLENVSLYINSRSDTITPLGKQFYHILPRYIPHIKILNRVFSSCPNPSTITDLFFHFSYIVSIFRASANPDCLLVK